MGNDIRKVQQLCIISAIAILYVALFYLNQKTITLPLKYEDEEYVLRYGIRFSGYWDKDSFYAKKSAMEATYTMHSPMKIKKEQVEQLMECLDLRKINLRKRMKAWDESGKKVTEITEKEAFQIYGLYSGDVPLIITKDGEIYINGYYYTGDRTKLQEFFPEFVEKSMAIASDELKDGEKVWFRTDEQGLAEIEDRMMTGLENINWEQSEARQEVREIETSGKSIEVQEPVAEVQEVEIQPFTPELAEKKYIMEYDRHFSNWTEGYFRANSDVNTPDKSFRCMFPRNIEEGGLTGSEIQLLFQTLDLTEDNIGERCLWKDYDSGVDSLLFYGADSNEGVLMLTSYGEIYVKGYRYLGDKKGFIEKIKSFFHDLEADWLSEEEKAFLEDVINQIEWK